MNLLLGKKKLFSWGSIFNLLIIVRNLNYFLISLRFVNTNSEFLRKKFSICFQLVLIDGVVTSNNKRNNYKEWLVVF